MPQWMMTMMLRSDRRMAAQFKWVSHPHIFCRNKLSWAGKKVRNHNSLLQKKRKTKGMLIKKTLHKIRPSEWMRLIISIDILKTRGYSSILIWYFRGVVYGIIEAIVSQFLLLLVYLRNYWIGSFNKTMSRQGVVCATRITHLDFRLHDILGGNYLLFAFETSLKVSFSNWSRNFKMKYMYI